MNSTNLLVGSFLVIALLFGCGKTLRDRQRVTAAQEGSAIEAVDQGANTERLNSSPPASSPPSIASATPIDVTEIPSGPNYRGRSIKEWHGDLKSENLESCAAAINAIGEIGPSAAPVAKSIVLQMYRKWRSPYAEEEPASRLLAGDAGKCISKIGPAAKNIVPDLEQALRSEDELVVNGALLASSGLGIESRPLIPSIIKLLKTSHRQAALMTLLSLGADASHAAYDVSKLIYDPDVRETAAEILINMGTKARSGATPTLTEALSDIDKISRLLAVRVFATIGVSEQRTVDRLIPFLDPEFDFQTRFYAARSLGSAGILAKSAEQPLFALLDELFKNTSYDPKNNLNSENGDSLFLESGRALASVSPENDAAVEWLLIHLVLPDEHWRFCKATKPEAEEIMRAFNSFGARKTLERLKEHGELAPLLGSFKNHSYPLVIAKLEKPNKFDESITVSDSYQESLLNALGNMGESAKGALPQLIEIIVHDGKPKLREMGFGSNKYSKNYYFNFHSARRRQAIRACGRIGPAAVEAAPAILDALAGVPFGFDGDDSIYDVLPDSFLYFGNGSRPKGSKDDCHLICEAALISLGPDVVPHLLKQRAQVELYSHGDIVYRIGKVALPHLARGLSSDNLKVREFCELMIKRLNESK